MEMKRRIESKEKGKEKREKSLMENVDIFSKEEMERLLKELEGVHAVSGLEKLPKNVLASIFVFLGFSELAKVWRVNKFFFKTLYQSNCATIGSNTQKKNRVFKFYTGKTVKCGRRSARRRV